MNYQEYGRREQKTILLLHGGGLSWWNYREAVSYLEDSFHVILPVLDGHSGSDRPFTTIKDNAEEIITFIDEQFNGSICLLGGLSLGAQIVLEILSMRKDICTHALIESAAVIPSKLTNSLIAPSIRSSYSLISNRTFASLQFRSLHMKEDLFEDYYRDSCRISKEDMIAFMKENTAYSLKDTVKDTKADIHLFYGEKETGVIKHSAALIKKALPDCTVQCLPGLYHGEFSLNHPKEYAKTIRNIIG
ncbi:MAG: alpha/beta hydrolase [Erysipelotrichaceae bacterium]|nr:alpha/beta hydrolase [Erysipelotrichaceae bacterium]